MSSRRKRHKFHKLPDDDLRLSLLKSHEILKTRSKFLSSIRSIERKGHLFVEEASNACMIFGQYEAGSAVCISADGLILTCCHCLMDNPCIGDLRCLVTSTGDVWMAEVVKFDSLRDLALLRCIGEFDLQTGSIDHPIWKKNLDPYPFVKCLYDTFTDLDDGVSLLTVGCPAVCIGQPGQEDLERSDLTYTGYPFIHASIGKYEGVIDGSGVFRI